MSRGLGKQQLVVLRALCSLERDHGAGWYYVHDVLNRAWDADWRAPYEQMEQRRAEADRERRARDKAAAAGGDLRALEAVDRQRHIDRIGRILSGRRVKTGTPTVRRGRDDANLSRVLALLRRRGLVERYAVAGRGAMVKLTEGGRSAASVQQQDARHLDRT